MDSQISIYEHLRETYLNTYVAQVNQTVDLHSSLPILLIEFPITVPSSNKDRSIRDFVTLYVHVINKDYSTALTAAKNVRTLLDGFSDQYVYECDFEKEDYIKDDEAEVYRFIVEFLVKI